MITGSRVMVEIFDDRIEISSPGGLPAPLTPEKFGTLSAIRNPNIAAMLQRFGYLERMGTGIRRINDLCDSNGNPRPRYDFSIFFTVIYDRIIEPLSDTVADINSDSRVESGVESGVESKMAVQILKNLLKSDLSKLEIALTLGKSKPTRYLNDLMRELINKEYVKYTVPDKPSSRNQKYRLTDKGRKLISD